jgi:hypothetical protein
VQPQSLGFRRPGTSTNLNGPGATLADAFAWVGFYRPEHEHGAPVRNLSEVTLADGEGRAVWNNYFKDVTQVAESGAVAI